MLNGCYSLSLLYFFFLGGGLFVCFWLGCTKCIRLIEWWIKPFFNRVIGYLHCVIKSPPPPSLSLSLPLYLGGGVVCFWPGCTKCIRLIEWWIKPFLIGYLHCVIKSSHTFWLTFFIPCTVVMDTLKMCNCVFGSFRTLFFFKFTCSWT
jgi:hypothetical protein